jgi:hypothetical protein
MRRTAKLIFQRSGVCPRSGMQQSGDDKKCESGHVCIPKFVFHFL